MRKLLLLLILVFSLPSAAEDRAAREAVEALEAYALYKMAQYDEAFLRFQKLAQRGNVQGMLNMANMLQAGLGVPRDESSALSWYRKAAGQGSAIGMYYTAQAYLDGIGVAVDIDLAQTWLTRAADAGSSSAQLHLGKLLLQNQQSEMALQRLKQAAAGGESEAELILQNLSGNNNDGGDIDITHRTLIESAWAAMDRAAEQRNAPGTVHYLSHDASVRVRLPGNAQWTSFDRSGYRQFWQQTFDRATTISIERLASEFQQAGNAILARSQLQEILLLNGVEQRLVLKESATMRIELGKVVIERLDIRIE